MSKNHDADGNDVLVQSGNLLFFLIKVKQMMTVLLLRCFLAADICRESLSIEALLTLA